VSMSYPKMQAVACMGVSSHMLAYVEV